MGLAMLRQKWSLIELPIHLQCTKKQLLLRVLVIVAFLGLDLALWAGIVAVVRVLF